MGALESGRSVRRLRLAKVTWDDVNLFRSLWDRTVFAGDMYEYISETETTLHRLVQLTLTDEYGADEA